MANMISIVLKDTVTHVTVPVNKYAFYMSQIT